MDPQVAFKFIQLYCIDVAKDCNVATVNELILAIERLISDEATSSDDKWCSVIDDLKEYIMFPLYVGLKKILQEEKLFNEQTVERIFSCLIIVLSKSSDIEWKIFQDLLMQVFFLLTTKENPQKISPRSEDCQRLALELVGNLCNCLNLKDFETYCSDIFRPQLGHAIFITLKIAENEKCKELRIVAIDALKSLGLYNHWLHMDARIINMCRLSFVNFLPGISVSMLHISTGSDIQGHKITMAALECLNYYITLVMRDSFIILHVHTLGVSDTVFDLQNKMSINAKDEIENMNAKKKSKFSIKPPDRTEPKLQAKIDRKWLNATSDQLSLLIMALGILVKHSHWKVRKALVQLANSIVAKCIRSLKKCLISCLDILIALSCDPILDISEDSKAALNNFQLNLSNDEELEIMELLEERLFALATKLPTIVKTQEDAKTACSLNQFFGTLNILSSRLAKACSLNSHLNRILSALANVLQLDISDKDFLNEKFTNEEFSFDFPEGPHIRESFVYFHSPSIVVIISNICHTIGCHGDMLQITDWCLDVIQQDSSRRKEVLLLLNLIMKGMISSTSNCSSNMNEQIVGSIIDVIINLNLLNCPIRVSATHLTDENAVKVNSLVGITELKQSISVECAKSNVLLTGCILKLLGTCSLVLKDGFKMFLNDILCLMMEKAGETNVYVSHSAFLALEDLGLSLGYNTVEDLIENNVSQFWFPLSQKLKKLPEYPSSPLVLRFALKCSKEVKRYIEDLVEDVLEALDMFHSESSLPLSIILLTFVEALIMKRLFKDKPIDDLGFDELDEEEILDISASSPLNIMENDDVEEKLFWDYLTELDNDYFLKNQHVCIEDGLSSDSKEGFKNYSDQKINQDCDQIEVKETKKHIPNFITLISNILEKCSYLLYTKDRKLQLLILQIVTVSCEILKLYEDQKLPAFHKLWKPLIFRLKDKDFVVSIKALETSVIMIKSSGDFMRKRFITEMFPSLLSFLKSQSCTSLDKRETSGYYLMPAFKAQLKLLENLPELVTSLDLGVSHAIELFNALVSYFDKRQPPLLVTKAKEICNSLYRLHPNLVWLSLTYLIVQKFEESDLKQSTPLNIHGNFQQSLHKEILQFYETIQ